MAVGIKVKSGGLEYSPGVFGKHVFRVREAHLRDRYAPLIRRGAFGAVKLDLVLRGLALNPAHTGNRPEPGIVIGRYSYEDLHDLARERNIYGQDLDDPRCVREKRKWVGEQMLRLERLDLLQRRARQGRPELIALRDDASGGSFDDPVGSEGSSYVTVSGAVIASGELAEWKAPEIAFYLVAMIAERYEADRRRRIAPRHPALPLGGGEWFQTMDWFANERGYRPGTHVSVDFSTSTLNRGLRSFKQKGLVEVRKSRRDPVTDTRFKAGWRNIYTNHFDSLDQVTPISDAELESVIAKLEQGDPAEKVMVP